MTVYVDDFKARFAPAHRPGRTYVMSHMIGTEEAELHAMAQRCGVAKRWYQRDHYDISQSVRSRAIAAGAVPITLRQLAAMACLRRAGYPMGTPETAVDRLRVLRGEAMAAEVPGPAKAIDPQLSLALAPSPVGRPA